jgi:hypothetical protein
MLIAEKPFIRKKLGGTMDRRTFLALLALASAAGSSELAAQVRQAETTGDMKHISKEDLLRAVYKVSLAPNGATAGTKALIHLGHKQPEAAQIMETTKSIALKAGSYENFRRVVDGQAPKGVKLSAQETALLRSVGRRLTGGAGGVTGRFDGNTWEGTGGNTWEGSSY